MNTEVLSIDMTRCRGRGACIDFLNDSLTEDSDGYPVPFNGTLRKDFALSPRDRALAQQAVEACPLRALKFQS